MSPNRVKCPGFSELGIAPKVRVIGIATWWEVF